MMRDKLIATRRERDGTRLAGWRIEQDLNVSALAAACIPIVNAISAKLDFSHPQIVSLAFVRMGTAHKVTR